MTSSDDITKFKINDGICRPIMKCGGTDGCYPNQLATLNVSSIKEANKRSTSKNNFGDDRANSDSFKNQSSDKTEEVDLSIAQESQCFVVKSNDGPEVLDCKASADASSNPYL